MKNFFKKTALNFIIFFNVLDINEKDDQKIIKKVEENLNQLSLILIALALILLIFIAAILITMSYLLLITNEADNGAVLDFFGLKWSGVIVFLSIPAVYITGVLIKKQNKILE